MCIIVAKKKNVAMPSLNILKNCFERNPDGAGIMLAAKGQVYGFKGLMTFEAFESKLKQLAKRFGQLDKMAVIMHFRIGTHGGNVPENTHPFPLSNSYDDLRALEWVSAQGMAHNGIIEACSYHEDILDERVSDTMVYIKRVVAPIAKYSIITKRRDLLEALEIAAGSKLAFMDNKGNIAIAGDFSKKDGVYYSNKSYEKHVYYTSPNLKNFHYYWGNGNYDIEDNYMVDYKDDVKYIGLSKDDENALKCSIARDYGLFHPLAMPFVTASGALFSNYDEYALDESTGIIYAWDSLNYDWIPTFCDDDYVFFEEDTYDKSRP